MPLRGGACAQADAYVVHCNWVKFNKKTRLVRDNLWFLKEDDSTCDADFDPLTGGCDRWCADPARRTRPPHAAACRRAAHRARQVHARDVLRARPAVRQEHVWQDSRRVPAREAPRAMARARVRRHAGMRAAVEPIK